MSLHYSIYTVGGTHIVEAFEYDTSYTSVGKFTFTPKDLLAEAGAGSTISLKNQVTEGYIFQNVAVSNLWKENTQSTNWSDLTEINEFLAATVYPGATIDEINDIGDVDIIKPTTNTDIKQSILVYDASVGKVVLGPEYVAPGAGSPPPEGFSSIFIDQEFNEISGLEFKQNSSTLKINTSASITESAKLMVGGNTIIDGELYFKNVFSQLSDLPSATTYHGMFAHVHATGAAYFAHASNWVRLANQSEIFDGDYNSLSNLPTLLQLGTTSTTALAGDTTTITTAQANAIVANTAKTSFPGFGTTAGTALEGNTALFDGNYASLSNIPSTFTPSAHTHTASEITDFDTEVSNNTSVAANTAKVGYTDAAVDLRIAAADIGDLSDVPATRGTAGQVLVVNSLGTALEYANQSGNVTSVNTQTGAVVLDTDDIAEGAANLYYTDVRVSSNSAVAANTAKVGYTDAAVDLRIAAASIDDLSDVDTSTVAPTNGQALVWNSTNSEWEPGTVSGGGSSPWTTSGSDIYYTTGNVGVGTTTPAKVFHAAGNSQIDGTLLVKTQYNAVILGSTTAGGGNSSQADGNVIVGHDAMSSYTYGNGISYRNVAIGSNALNSGTGAYNVAVGRSSMASSYTRTNTVGVGDLAFQQGGGSGGVAVGSRTGRYANGSLNTLVGGLAGQGTSGTSTFANTVAVGYQALTALTTGASNTAVGYQAGDVLTTGGSNTLLGDSAGGSITTGYFNTLIGAHAGANSGATKQGRTAIGASAGQYNNGDNNTIVGNNAMAYSSFSNSVAVGQQAAHTGGGSSAVHVGYRAGRNTTGNNNVTIGYDAGLGVQSSTTYENTVAVGYQALTALTTGAGNTAVGYQASDAMTVSAYTTALGYQALSAVNATDANADGSTAVGYQALTALTTGTQNTAVGYQAGDSITTTSYNTLFGYQAGQGYASPTGLVAIGSSTGKGSSSYSVFVGHLAGTSVTGQDNSVMGFQAMSGTGQKRYNVAIGRLALAGTGSSDSNVAIGHAALDANGNKSYNVAIGHVSGSALTTGSSNVLIGYQSGSTLTTESNKLYIENSNSTTPLIYGEFDNDILRVNGTLQVNDPASTGYAFPAATGTLGQVLEVNASGDLVFATPSGGGGSSQWTTVNTNEIYYNSGNVGIGNTDPNAALDVNGDVDIELDSTTSETFTIHDGTHDLFQVDTGTTGTLFSVNDVSGLPKLEVDEDEGVIAKSIKVDDNALTAAGQYGKGAEIWYQGTSTPTAGSVYYLDSSGNWANTDASAVATAKGMLSVSAGADSDVDGMVIKGFVYVSTDPGGSVGDVVYLSETANQLTTTAPTTASAVVRVCGYKVGTNVVYFDPSKDWIELS